MVKVVTQNRLKSKVFWLGIVSIIGLIGQTFGWYTIPAGAGEIVANIVMAILGAFGVSNNPSAENKF